MISDKSVIIADDDPVILDDLTFHFKSLGFNVRSASDDFEVLAMVLKNWPDLLIIDIDRQSGNGFGVVERILQEANFTPFTEIVSLPVIVLTNKSDDYTFRECEALGVRHVLKEPHMWDKLKPLICELVQIQDMGMAATKVASISQEQPEAVLSAPKVLIIDDDPDIIKAIKIRLECHGVDTCEASNGVQGYQVALQEKPDLIITDYSMPEGGAHHMLHRLQQHIVTQNIPVIVLTGWTLEGRKDFSLERDMKGRCGVKAYLSKPIDFDLLLDELRRHIKLSSFSRLSAAVPS